MSIELVVPSSHFILCCSLLLLPPIPPSIRVFSNESTLRMRWPKYWTFSLSIMPSKEIPGLISFRTDWLDLLAVQGTLKSLLQHHSSKASILQCSAFFTVQLSYPYMTKVGVNGDLLWEGLCHTQICCTHSLCPCSRQLSTHASTGDSWTLTGKSGPVSCGVTAPFSWVLVCTKFCLCPPRVCPQSYVSSGGSMVGLMMTSSKRVYAIPRSAAPRAPAPVAVHCWPVPSQETLKHSSISVSVGSLGPGAYKLCLSLLTISGGYGFWF